MAKHRNTTVWAQENPYHPTSKRYNEWTKDKAERWLFCPFDTMEEANEFVAKHPEYRVGRAGKYYTVYEN